MMIFSFQGKRTKLRPGDLIVVHDHPGRSQTLRFVRSGEPIQMMEDDKFYVGKFLNVLANFRTFCRLVTMTHGLTIVPAPTEDRPLGARYCLKVAAPQT